MDEESTPAQDRARQIVKDYVAAQSRTASGLAGEAQINRSILSRWLNGHAALSVGSALKLLCVMEDALTSPERRTFVLETGLPLTLLEAALTSPGAGPDLSLASLGPEGAGHYLMALAHRTAPISWAKAIPLFQDAEEAFGPCSSAAARAATMTAQLCTNLGDYARARQELQRLFRTYEEVMDPYTEVHACHAWGMLHYYLAELPEAEKWFQRFARVSQEWGLESMSQMGQHFLGRVYTAWGRLLDARRDQGASDLFHKAEVQFDTLRPVRLKTGDDAQMAYDLLRLAQLRHAQCRLVEAHKLLKRARELFGRDQLAACHVGLEDARLIQVNGEARGAASRAGRALEAFGQISYAKGMADALRILAISESMQQRPVRALHHYVAAFYAFPFDNYVESRELWDAILILRQHLMSTEGRTSYQRLVGHMREMIETRQGEYASLAHLAADRSAEVARILSVLEQGSSALSGK